MKNHPFRGWPRHATSVTCLLLILGILDNQQLRAGVDPEFNCVLGGENGEVFALAKQTDGRFVIAGNFTSFQGIVRYGVARILASGKVDPTFDAGLILPASVGAVQIQYDGRLVLGGAFQSVNGTTRASLIRLGPDGALDVGFNPPPLLNRSGKPAPVNTLLILPDGRIVAGGSFETAGGVSHRRLARFAPNGDLDATFRTDVNGTTVASLTLQPDGKILIGGSFQQINGTSRQNLARLNPDGSLDPSFDSRQFAHGECSSILVETDGTIVITTGGSCRRLASDGKSLDPDFVEPEFGLNARAYRAEKTPDGGYAVGGEFYSSGNRFSLAGITIVTNIWVAVGDATYAYPDNHPNRADLVDFMQQSIHRHAPLQGVAFGNGALVAINGSTNIGTTSDLLRWNFEAADLPGGLNAVTFAEGQFVAVGFSNTIAICSDHGKTWSALRVSGTPSADLFGIGIKPGQRVVVGGNQASGVILSSTAGGPWTGDTVGTNRLRAVTFGSDRWVVVGERGSIYTSIDAKTWTAVTNVYTEDLHSIAFGNGHFVAVGDSGRIIASANGQTWKSVYNYSVQQPLQSLLGITFAQGKFMVVGKNGTVFASDPNQAPPNFYFVPRYLLDQESISVVRLDRHGVVQTEFNSGIRDQLSNYMEGIRAIIPEGSKLIVAGQFVKVHATNSKGEMESVDSGDVARLRPDGALDTDLAIGMGVAGESPPSALLTQPDGELLLGGDFTSVNGVSRNRIARVHADGSLDADFNPGTGADRLVACIALAPRNQIVIGGRFNNVGGLGSRPVARLNSDGTPDPGFVLPPSGAAFNDTITTIAVDGTGRVLVNGSSKRVMRLQATGEQDFQFQIGNGASGGGVSSIAIQPDGRIVIGGSFTNFNSVTVAGVIRLLPSGEIDEAFRKNLGTGPNQSVNTVMVRTGAANSSFFEILLSGAFTRINDHTCNHFARLATDGTLDRTFGSQVEVNTNLNLIAARNGETTTIPVFVSGPFTTFAGVNRAYTAALNLDGTFHSNFNTGTGPDGSIYALSPQMDGKVILGGAFKSVDGKRHLSLIRMLDDQGTTPVPTPMTKWAETYFTPAEMEDPAVTDAKADPDLDGIPNLIEYAFNLNPKVVNTLAVPAAAIEQNNTTGESHLIYNYRRRTGDSGLSYSVELSGDLANWMTSDARVEELNVIRDATGLMETVSVRIHPSIEQLPVGFVRCRITLR